MATQTQNQEILNSLLGKEGVKFDISIDTQTIIFLSLGIFGAVVLGSLLVKFLTRNM